MLRMFLAGVGVSWDYTWKDHNDQEHPVQVSPCCEKKEWEEEARRFVQQTLVFASFVTAYIHASRNLGLLSTLDRLRHLWL